MFEETKKLFDTPIHVLNEKIKLHSDDFEHNRKLVNTFALSEIDKIYKLFDVQ